MTIQMTMFAVLLMFHLFYNRTEMKVMKNIKPVLIKVEEEQLSHNEINRELNICFNKQSTKSNYVQQWNKYFSRISQKKSDEKIKVEPYFGIEAMDAYIGKRHILDYGGGLHVSLGVLGTFIGLAYGLTGLDPTASAEVLQDGIGSLITNMKTAFYTSLLGVGLSIVWTFVDRGVSKRTENNIEWHSNQLMFLLDVDDEEVFLNRLEKISQQQADQLKTILIDALEDAMNPFVQTVQNGNESMQSSFNTMQQQLEAQSKVAEEHLAITKNQGSEVSDKLVNEIKEETSESIAQFIDVMKTSKESQESMVQAVQQVVTTLEQASATQEQLTTKTDQMLGTFDSLAASMEGTHEKYDQTFDNLNTLTEMIQEMQTTQNDLLPQLSKWNEEVVNMLEGFTDLSSKQYEEMTSQLAFSNEQWEKTAEDFKATRETLNDSLKEFTSNIESGVTSTFQLFDKELESVVKHFKSMSDAYIESQEDMTDALFTFTEKMKEQRVEVES